jgi:hypothetical protein
MKDPKPSGILEWEKPVDWSEDFQLPTRSSNICFTASSYKSWCDSVFPQLVDMPTCESIDTVLKNAGKNERCIRIGDYYLSKLTFPVWEYATPSVPHGWLFKPQWTRARLSVHRSATQVSHCGFDGPVDIPILSKINDDRLRTWMSLTPNEVITLRSHVRRARGTVGIAGLGMGWFARRVLERKVVQHVTIVEKDPQIIKYFGGLLSEFGDRVDFVAGDAYNHNWDDYDVTLWDIWEKIGDSAWDSRFLKIRDRLRNAGKVCEGWTCWAGLR